MTRKRGKRSTRTPPTRRKRSMGARLKTGTAPMAVADPVFSSTHQESAMRYRLSPRRETVCPDQRSAKGRWRSESKSLMARTLAPLREWSQPEDALEQPLNQDDGQ